MTTTAEYVEQHLRDGVSDFLRPHVAEVLSELDALARAKLAPVPMRITCPDCGELHIDEGEFATKPHHTHSCQSCGLDLRTRSRHD